MQSVLAVVLIGCVAAVSAITLVREGPIERVAEDQRAMYVNNGPYARGKGLNTNQNNKLNVHHIGIQADQDGIDARFNGPQPRGGVLQYTFKPDFDALICPKTVNSDWRWAMTSENKEVVLDNATFVRTSPNSIKLISVPYKSHVAQDNTRMPPIANSYEALLVNKQNITVLPGQKLAVNLVFSCKTVNNGDAPLINEQSQSVNPEDDPSLAACGFGIQSNDESALDFSIIATNKGIWVLYERNRFELLSHPERNQREFTIFKKIADRSSAYETIDATIVYDHAQNKVEFLINGQVAYTLSDLGTITQSVQEQPAYKDVYNVQREDLQQKVEPQDFQVVVGLTGFSDAIDPNNPTALHAKKLTTDPTYYEDNAKFQDNESQKMYDIWGQGAEMTLVSANIKLEGTATGAGKVNPNNVGRHSNDRRRGKSLYPSEDSNSEFDNEDENKEQ